MVRVCLGVPGRLMEIICMTIMHDGQWDGMHI